MAAKIKIAGVTQNVTGAYIVERFNTANDAVLGRFYFPVNHCVVRLLAGAVAANTNSMSGWAENTQQQVDNITIMTSTGFNLTFPVTDVNGWGTTYTSSTAVADIIANALMN